jgi:recombination protein RecA
MAKEVKKQTAEEALIELNKIYGKGTVISKKNSEFNDVEPISTGSFNLDRATGINGIPRGRVIEIVGPESSGKTTLAIHILKNAQRMGKVAVIDIEQTFDLKYADSIGLDLDNLYFAQPEYGEMSFDIMKKLISTGEFSAIALDSVAANIPKEQYEGETGQSRLARLAALMSMEMPKISIMASKNNCAVIMLNQFRNNIGGYGNPLKAAGGDALPYYASMRIEVRKSNEIEDKRNLTKVKIFKNKVSMPFGTAEFYIDWGKGINQHNEILDLAVECDLIKKAGAGWYTLEGDIKVQGDIKVLEYFNDNPEYFEHIRNQITEKLK